MIRRSAARATTVSPADAARWLSSCARVRQRRPIMRNVEHLTQQIRNGTWRASSTICVCADGLVDGQHRLLAIMQTGEALPLRVRVITDRRLRCMQCPESCHLGGQRTRTKPSRIQPRSFQRRR